MFYIYVLPTFSNTLAQNEKEVVKRTIQFVLTRKTNMTEEMPPPNPQHVSVSIASIASPFPLFFQYFVVVTVCDDW